MRLKRLLRMPPSVLVDRGRQEFSRTLDRYAISHHGLFPRCWNPNRISIGGPVNPDCISAAVRRLPPGVLEAAPALLDPRSVERIRASAEAFCAGRFSFLGYEGLSYGLPPDWHLDPITQRRSPRMHWSRIDPLDPSTVGDSKVVWELNRHQWLVRLGQAYRLTGEEHYAEHFAQAVSDWMRENPPGIGINWASSLEVALRLIAWCWALVLFRDSPALTASLKSDMLAWIKVHAAHVYSYLSRSFSPNTHLTGEALGLYYAGTVFPGLDAGGRWRKRGREILLQELPRQVYEDGVYFEQSTCYQRYTVEIYLHLMLLARYNADALPDRLAGRVQLMLDWLLAMQHPDGTMPQIGDADGGWLLPFEPRKPSDCRGVFAVAAALFRRSDYAWAAAGETSEAVWFLGHSGYRVCAEQAMRPPRVPASRLFPRGGYAVMRTGWEREAHQLLFDAGPLGCQHSAGHGHADLLGIQCAAFGHPVLVDSGTYCYTPEPAWRNYFRGTFAHNTAVVDGTGQALPLSTFRWKARPTARMQAWTSAPEFDYADAEHSAFSHLPGAVKHRRRILFVKRVGWVIVDDFTGDGVHEVQLRYQFAPLKHWRQFDGWSQGMVSAQAGLLLRTFAPVELEDRVLTGSMNPLAGWVSPAYGQRCRAPQLNYRALSALPLRLISVLIPVANVGIEKPFVNVEFCGNGDTRMHLQGLDVQIGNDTPSIEYQIQSSVEGLRRNQPEECLPCAP